MSATTTWAEQLCDEVLQNLPKRFQTPDATYRLQFTRDFTFRQASALVSYLRSLGISHIYASPYLKARPGSQHGYDVCDHSQLNPELGDMDDYDTFVETLRAHGMGHILDVVPNHMGIATAEAKWWQDVLENGPSSPYARFFDIDWKPVQEQLRNKVLLPTLGDQYGDVLESGQLRLHYEEGAFTCRYFENSFPLDPKTVIPILSHRMEELKAQFGDTSEEVTEYQSIITNLDHLPDRRKTDADSIAERQREKEILKRRLDRHLLAYPQLAEFLKTNLAHFNGDPQHPESFDRLDDILQAQPYRLSHWKAASDEINYRRFFDINELAALCMENHEVFEATHALVFDLLLDGKLDGLRIDHIDGLYDPTEYLWNLQTAYLNRFGRRAYEKRLPATCDSPEAKQPTIPTWEAIQPVFTSLCMARMGMGKKPLKQIRFGGKHADSQKRASLPLYILVEKILGPDERLPEEWPVAGTTGYDFLNLLNGLLVEPAGLSEIERLYGRFLEERQVFHEIVYATKLLILQVAMSSELQMLAYRLNRISEQNRHSRDFTLNMLRFALRQIIACFPLYRTYIGSEGVTQRDRNIIHLAIAQAKRRNPAIDTSLFDFVRDTLLLEFPPNLAPAQLREREFFVGRFQQVTSPVTAKGIEDTAFYRYIPLTSLNEVGSEPVSCVTTVDVFHEDNLARFQTRPASMLCSTTHDTKRSEDVRARLNVLSEMPKAWKSAFNKWARLNRRHVAEVDGRSVPSRNDEYLFYQSLLGIWPLQPPTPEEHEQLIVRMQQYMEKATHEAKVHTSWISPNVDYDRCLNSFVSTVMQRRAGNRFLADFVKFHETLIEPGLYSSLSQTLLKLTSPGVPDIYQGQEIWDFSLVDPDNRRPVNFDRCRRLLEELEGNITDGVPSLGELAEKLAATPRDDRLKLFVTWRTLRFRRSHTDLFRQGEYIPLAARGEKSDHVVAFARRWQNPENQTFSMTIVVVPRLIHVLTASTSGTAPQGTVWGDTVLDLSSLPPHETRNIFTGEEFKMQTDTVQVSQLLAKFPLAMFSCREVNSA